MTLRAEILADQDPRRGKCALCRWLDLQPEKGEEGREAWTEALSDQSFTSSSVYRALLKRGVKISYSTVDRHRREHAFASG